MQDDTRVFSAESPQDVERLSTFLSGRGVPFGALRRHLARPRYRPALTRVAEVGGEVAGCALLAHTRMSLGAATIETGHVERIDITRKGMAAGAFEALLGDSLRALMEEGLPLVTLEGARELYEPLGCAPYRFDTSVEMPGATVAPGTIGNVRLAGSNDAEDLAALYAASYRDLPLAEARVAPDWQWRVGAGDIHVLEDARGRVVAYAALVGGGPGPSLRVVEAAAADAGAARALLNALAPAEQRSSPGHIQLELPLAHPVALAALHLGGEGHIVAAHTGRDAAALAGVIDLPMLLDALAPEIERRLARSRYAGWSGNLRVELAAERITLALAGGRATVIDGTRPADVRLRRVELPALAQLLLGYRPAADLRATGGLDCDDSALGLIDALFPVVG